MKTASELIEAIEASQSLVDGEINGPDRGNINDALNEICEKGE